MTETIHTTTPAVCRSCGMLTPHYEHERTRVDTTGRCVCGVCLRLQKALAPLLDRIEALENEAALYKAKTTPRK